MKRAITGKDPHVRCHPALTVRMPKREVAMPAKQELPSTLRRSSKKAQDTWSKAHDRAVETYGEGERAHRTAYSALKRSFEKVGDRWRPKRSKGPSDPRARASQREARAGKGKTYGGVDVEGRTRQELMDLARRLDVRGRSRMTKDELGEAIDRANTRATARARARD
jgi:cation transport regulator ChaB